MTLEHDIATAYGWPLREIDDAPAWEVWQHWGLIRQREARRDIWAVSVQTFKHASKQWRQETLARLREQAMPRRRKKSPYDLADDETRVLLIGSALATGGASWAASHGRQMQWLAERSISPEQAIERHRERLAIDLRSAGFVPANPKPKLKKKKKRKT